MKETTDIIWKKPTHKKIEKTPEYEKAVERLFYLLFDEPYSGNKDLKPQEDINYEKRKQRQLHR